jgi:hypothetical protein
MERKSLSVVCVVSALIAAVTLVALAYHSASTSEGETSRPTGDFRLYYDPEMRQIVQRIIPSVASQGWNNQSFYLLNCGSKPFLLAMAVTMPSDCEIAWNYNNSPVYPGQKIPLTILLFLGNRTAAEFSRLQMSVQIYTLTPVK